MNADRFFHRYQYDSENRLTGVRTSRDKLIWQRDARYYYYKHGPLARTELGQLNVQGVDYAYTVQGWLKGVNSMTNGSTHDMGGEGSDITAKDVYGFGLNYYDNKTELQDYKPISGVAPVAFPRPSTTAGIHSLYNGNIAAMDVALQHPGDTPWDALQYQYQYDQLNRITGMTAYKGLQGNQWTPLKLDDYKEKVKYDPNGNILNYERNGYAVSGHLEIDRLTYRYKIIQTSWTMCGMQ